MATVFDFETRSPASASPKATARPRSDHRDPSLPPAYYPAAPASDLARGLLVAMGLSAVLWAIIGYIVL